MRKKPKKSGEPTPRVKPLVRGGLNNKTKGELGELAFVHKAASLGFGVAKPHGAERYDFVLDSGERMWRVQVKSTYSVYRSGYRTLGHGSNPKPYQTKEIDFLVAYIVPRDTWYIIPVSCITFFPDLYFYPSGCRTGGYFESYREAWHLMAPGANLKPEPLRASLTRAIQRRRWKHSVGGRSRGK
jgi:hypothetical protein